ncbi:putative LETM1 and EF-hand domain-containing protein 1, mitochondrial [Iris pallida]|uniref:LETM1 and EF-hand domain-containing protein 1, mitochondrial n=1 Tax=Iris pallida TaxID=29817 RepID=A0AAX6H363_IRIPA|nr:putative LETM1 and EF-hand domain-containing protein 1, mitochondrial [Iris pallida]KAJ6839845.1 putative LETM1 and EF-hand domain-containing protein 1, mitochondrial [Iris pallida]
MEEEKRQEKEENSKLKESETSEEDVALKEMIGPTAQEAEELVMAKT